MNLIDEIRETTLRMKAEGTPPVRVKIPEARRNELMCCWQMHQFEGMIPDLIWGLPYVVEGEELIFETS